MPPENESNLLSAQFNKKNKTKQNKNKQNKTKQAQFISKFSLQGEHFFVMTSWFTMYKGAIQLRHMCASPIRQWITYSVHLFSKQLKAGKSV